MNEAGRIDATVEPRGWVGFGRADFVRCGTIRRECSRVTAPKQTNSLLHR